jgi:hypothetical protein
MSMLFPVFAMFALTLFVSARMGYARYAAVAKHRVDPKYYQLYRGEEPAELRKLSRHYLNLFELPTLFYAVCIMAHVTGQTGTLPVALAWAFVALRCVHSYIHLGSNVVVNRFRVFMLGVLVLLALMLVVFLGIT